MNHITLRNFLLDTLATLRAVHWHAWTLHWKTQGSTYYSDHLLFQRLYSGDQGGPDINAQIDGLGERIVALYGAAAIDESFIERRVVELLDGSRAKSENEPIKQAQVLETYLLQVVTQAAGQAAGLPASYSVALDNYLRAIADERSTVSYLLGQRLGK